MRRASVILAIGFAGVSSALAAGCQQQTFSDQEKADIRESWKPGGSPPVVHPQSAVLAQGPAPLLYEAQESGTIHVTDSASGTALVTASVTRGTVIRIDPENGIYIGERHLRAGPLGADRRFSVTLDLAQGNEWQSRMEAPRPAPPPASRPENENRSSL